MSDPNLLKEIIATYRRHGWQLQRVLTRPEMRAALAPREEDFENASIQDAEFGALWFSRPSHEGRAAWELRLVAEQQYALFEVFEPDETEEQSEEVRREMEARMREHLAL